MTSPAIWTHGLTCDFQRVRALDQLSLEIPPGIVFGYLGPNGAGKTTTIRLLLGLLEPSLGEAEVLGFNTRTHAHEIRRRTGALLEHPGLYERLTAEENLDLVGRIWHMPYSKRKARQQELLTHLGLWERRKDRIGNWSRGMKQKLAMARALFHRPSLLFLDEPTAGLDPEAASALRADIQSLAAQDGTTVFLTTHNLAEAEKLCHQVGVIRQGKLLVCGSPGDLRNSMGSAQVEIIGREFTDAVLGALRNRPEIQSLTRLPEKLILNLNGASRTAPLVRMLVEAGVEIEEVRKGHSSLEDIYMTLMEEGEE
ncbi:MAG: ABC transporter ATP-binding protein [Candidatus Omnitrophica bacterium]|nr:ABC transporter ATP-binding protein [Candidatus Omnitrophota bacterium]HPP02576.1 ABC transporter ATP-binding protein [bacterium]